MSDLTSSLFTPSRTRNEPAAPAPAPERKAAESNGSDFARSLATVRGLARSAAAQDRAAASRSVARSDEREANEAPAAVRSRAQVQALMLSGAMKFAATRSVDTATVPGTPTPAPAEVPSNGVMQAGVVITDAAVPMPLVASADLPVPAVVAAPLAEGTTTEIVAAPAIARWVPPADDATADEPVLASDLIENMATQPDQSASAAATVAAMQLVATLPIAEAPVVETSDAFDARRPTPSTIDNNDDAARAAWRERVQAMQAAVDETVLVEDHFDAPAIASATLPVTASASALRDVVPANVTVTVVDASADAAPATSAVTTTKPTTVRAAGHGVERDMAQLSPEFRERLQRVIDRMQQEYGHDVTVIETVRSQARQAALFAQGRTAPGPVVTWTRNSKHSKGLAADLMVDGQWDNPAGYAHLAQIAKQEGLRTLGARDPGHVELPADGSVSSDTLDALLGDLAGEAGDNARKVRAELEVSGRERDASALARVADVAQVARVSQVAQVARVASVARPGAAPSQGEPRGAEAVSPLAVSGPTPQFMTDATAAARLAAPVSSVNMADRIGHLLDLQASQSARPLNSVLLRMDNANGIEDQIRIDTRGTSVDAQLGLGSAQQAAELSGRVNELREALERRGLTADGVRVQAAPRTTDSVNFSRMTAPALDVAAMRAGADAQAQGNPRDQASRDQQQREALAREQERHTPRSSSDDTRHRSRREQPETRQ